MDECNVSTIFKNQKGIFQNLTERYCQHFEQILRAFEKVKKIWLTKCKGQQSENYLHRRRNWTQTLAIKFTRNPCVTINDASGLEKYGLSQEDCLLITQQLSKSF